MAPNERNYDAKFEEIAASLATIRAKLDLMNTKLAEVADQARITNGRVSALEKWKYGLLVGLGTLAATKWPAIGIAIREIINAP